MYTILISAVPSKSIEPGEHLLAFVTLIPFHTGMTLYVPLEIVLACESCEESRRLSGRPVEDERRFNYPFHIREYYTQKVFRHCESVYAPSG